LKRDEQRNNPKHKKSVNVLRSHFQFQDIPSSLHRVMTKLNKIFLKLTVLRYRKFTKTILFATIITEIQQFTYVMVNFF